MSVIPHRGDVLFENFELFDNYLVAQERIKGLSNLRIINTKDGGEHYLNFGEEAYTAGININPNSNTDILRYSYSSLTTPNSVIDYNMITKEKKVMKEDVILGGFDKNNYESKDYGQKPVMEQWCPSQLSIKKDLLKMVKLPCYYMPMVHMEFRPIPDSGQQS